MDPFHIVIDTNVLLTALRSNLGASFKLLSLVGNTDRFVVHVSVPLVLEYEDVTSRPDLVENVSPDVIRDILDYLCVVAHHHSIFFLWRPYLKDPKDDMVLELAVEAKCDYIITFNLKDFAGVERFDLKAITPQQFLKEIGEIP